MDAHKIRVGQGLQPAGYDGPVLALHPHHVGNGADGGQSAVPGEQRVLTALPPQGQYQLQGHAHAGQVLEGIGTVGPVGVHHRGGPGKGLLAPVVVCYHYVQSDGGGKIHLFVAGDTTVHGDHQCGSLVPQGLDGVLGQSVAVLNPPGNIPQAFYAAVF